MIQVPPQFEAPSDDPDSFVVISTFQRQRRFNVAIICRPPHSVAFPIRACRASAAAAKISAGIQRA